MCAAREALERLREGNRRFAVRVNIQVSADQLRHGSSVLEQLIKEDGLLVVGAEYSLETGVVDFFDGVPDSGYRDAGRWGYRAATRAGSQDP